jgi:membrane-associated phospholipid phosphatase
MNYLDFAALFQTTVQMLYALGFFSEMIIVILCVYLFYNNGVDLFFFLAGIFGSSVANRLLKPLFKNPRPSRPIKFLESEELPRKIDYTKNTNFYGMPSGHSQQVAYCLTYLYLVLPDESWQLRYGTLAIGAAMMFERWWFRNHTAAQLMVGLLVGIAFGYLVVFARNKWKKMQKK